MARDEEKKENGGDSSSSTRGEAGEHGSISISASIGAHHVYIKHDDHGWVPARLVSLDKLKQEATVTVEEYPDEQAMLMTSALAGRRSGEPAAAEEEHASNTFVVDISSYEGGFLPPQNANDEGELEEYEDMVDMPYLHEVRFSSSFSVLFPFFCVSFNPQKYYLTIAQPKKNNLEYTGIHSV